MREEYFIDEYILSIDQFKKKKDYIQKIIHLFIAYNKPDAANYYLTKYKEYFEDIELRYYAIITKSLSFKISKKEFIR